MPRKKRQADDPGAQAQGPFSGRAGAVSVDQFYKAQDMVEEGNPEEAKKLLESCLERLRGGTDEATSKRGKKAPGKGPPQKVLESAVLNALGELYLDEALTCSGQLKLTAQAAKVATAKAKQYFMQSNSESPVGFNASACISLASIARDGNHLTSAVDWYRKALHRPEAPEETDWADTWVFDSWECCRPVAYYHLALLYSQGVVHEGSVELLDILRRFGVRYRLSNEVWAVASSSATPETPYDAPPHPGRPRLLSNVVPPQLLSSLSRAFSPKSPYWEETSYSGRGYFSWAYDPATPPSSLVEDLIQLVIEHSGIREKVKYTEWWAHTRLPGRDIGHQLHFDMEEKTLEATGEILHPLLSTVVYLTGAETGGMTLVANQKVGDTSPDVGGWAAHPVDGAVLYFPGDLLHGALPSLTRSQTSKQRLALLVALWGTSEFSPPAEGVIGPQTRVSTLEDATWVEAVRGQRYHPSATPTPPQELPVATIARVWQPIPPGGIVSDLAIPETLDQRFFMPHLDFKQVLMNDHCRRSENDEDEEEED